MGGQVYSSIQYVDDGVVLTCVEHAEGPSKRQVPHNIKSVEFHPTGHIGWLATRPDKSGHQFILVLLHPHLVAPDGFVAESLAPHTSSLGVSRRVPHRMERDQRQAEIIIRALGAFRTISLDKGYHFWVYDRYLIGGYSNNRPISMVERMYMPEHLAITDLP